MKIRQLLTVLTITMAASVITSCQKAVGDPQLDNPPMEAGGTLPSQIKIHYFSDDYTEVCSLQYDTSNRVIRIFKDDTTTVNPYDALRAQYDYNEAGYLIKFRIIYDDQDSSTSVISRDANNQIRYVTELDVFPQDADTTFFNFSQTPAGVIVETQYRYPVGGQSYSSHKRFTYSSQWRLLKVEELERTPFTINYQYSQDMLTEYAMTWNGSISNSMKFEYTSGLPSGGADRFHELLCGKDYYLMQIKALNYFDLVRDGDYYYLSITDPQHPTKILSFGVDQDNGPSTEVTTYTYQVNGAGQVVRIAIGHEYDPAEVFFTY